MNTIIEQIKAEIERRIIYAIGFRDNVEQEELASFFNGEVVALKHLLSLLSTLKSEKPSEGLEEAAEAEEDRVIEEVEKDDRGCPYISSTHVYNAFVRGAKWQKEQMMKGAVKCEYDQYPAVICLPAPIPRMDKGDKVRIIIVKED